MNDHWAQQFLVSIVVGALAVLMVGGSIAGWLIGRTVPEWLIGFDGVVVTAAFGAGAFFGQARTTAMTLDALAESRANHHALAMAALTTTPTPGTEPAVQSITAGELTHDQPASQSGA